MDIVLEKNMSIFTPDKETDTIVKAVIVRVDYVQDDNYRLLCMLGNEKAPIVIKTKSSFYRDGDYIEVHKSILKDSNGKITYQDYKIDKNVSLVDECRRAKEDLLIVLGIKK